MENYNVYFVQYCYGTNNSYDRYGSWIIAQNEEELKDNLAYRHKCKKSLITISGVYVRVPLNTFIAETNGLFNCNEELNKIFDKYYKED